MANIKCLATATSTRNTNASISSRWSKLLKTFYIGTFFCIGIRPSKKSLDIHDNPWLESIYIAYFFRWYLVLLILQPIYVGIFFEICVTFSEYLNFKTNTQNQMPYASSDFEFLLRARAYMPNIQNRTS